MGQDMGKDIAMDMNMNTDTGYGHWQLGLNFSVQLTSQYVHAFLNWDWDPKPK
jgi:hypothetical protein